MGLLDRWLKKKTAEQLNREPSAQRDATEKAPVAETSSKQEAAFESTKPVKKVVKPVSKKQVSTKEEKAKDSAKTDVFPTSSTTNKTGVYHKVIAPIVTEKTNLLQAHNQYVFEVACDATKEQVKKAVQQLYGITPRAINMMHVQGKFVRFGRTIGRRSDFKKAIITLPPGSSIKINETV